MELVNRVALIVRPKRRFAEWVNSLDMEEDEPSFDLDSERNNPTTYLVAAIGLEVPDLSELVDMYGVDIFETELEGWWTDEARWPVNRNPHVFRDWFDVALSSLAWDMDDAEPIYAADDDDLSDGMPRACAWCGTPIDEDAPVVTVSLKGPRDESQVEASMIELAVAGRIVPALVPKDDSDAARDGILALVMFCDEPCAEAFKDAWEKERGAMNS
jgi:hypothetical protein